IPAGDGITLFLDRFWTACDLFPDGFQDIATYTAHVDDSLTNVCSFGGNGTITASDTCFFNLLCEGEFGIISLLRGFPGVTTGQTTFSLIPTGLVTRCGAFDSGAKWFRLDFDD